MFFCVWGYWVQFRFHGTVAFPGIGIRTARLVHGSLELTPPTKEMHTCIIIALTLAVSTLLTVRKML